MITFSKESVLDALDKDHEQLLDSLNTTLDNIKKDRKAYPKNVKDWEATSLKEFKAHLKKLVIRAKKEEVGQSAFHFHRLLYPGDESLIRQRIVAQQEQHERTIALIEEVQEQEFSLSDLDSIQLGWLFNNLR